MTQVAPNLFYGPMCACTALRCAAVVHACKHPCFPAEYRSTPTYTVERGNQLFLNMIDPDRPLFVPELFTTTLDFIDRHIKDRKVIVHCNKGLSRSPSLVLLWLAKRGGTQLSLSLGYPDAALAFAARFPYRPNLGIQRWLDQHWNELR